MKKIIILVATMILTATMANANTDTGNLENTSAENSGEETVVSNDYDISTAGTDMSMLESKNAILPAPKEGSEKDVAYWSQSVLSRLKVLGYAQAGYTATMHEGCASQNTNTFDMKRAVLMVGADIAPQFYAFFMHEFKNNSLQEYYMEYRPCKAVNFRFGQSKIELSMANPLSPRVLESINCSPQAVSWLCGSDPLMSNGSGRDLGFMMYGNLFKNQLYYVLEVVNGGQINTADKNNQKNIVAKLEYKPVKNLRLSVSGQKGYGYAVKTSDYNTTVAVGETYKEDRWAAGFEWMSSQKGSDWFKNRCAFVRCEALGGRDKDVHSFGAYAATTIPVYKQWDVVAQADYFDRNTDFGYKQTNLTAGIQLWVHTKNRIQLQYTYSILSDAMKQVSGNCSNYGSLMAQVQFSF